jgi:hypothetical protein
LSHHKFRIVCCSILPCWKTLNEANDFLVVGPKRWITNMFSKTIPARP